MLKPTLAGNSIAATTVIMRLLAKLVEKDVLSMREVGNLLMEAADLQCDLPDIPRSQANSEARDVILEMWIALKGGADESRS